jgi:ligand-binding SRPBCC domain-containing protein
VRQRLTARITGYERPHRFVDEQITGAFAWFRHEHLFVPDGAGTIMIDRFMFAAPLGLLGWCAEQILLARYMRRPLRARALVLKAVAEQVA